MRTMGQKRAEFALQEILNLKLQGKTKDDFKSFTAGAPSMILQNGFGQSLAFWIAKGTKDNHIKNDDKHIIMFDIIVKWLSFKGGDIDNNYIEKKTNRADFIMAISKMEQEQYLTAQNETLALLEWVKRYANADL